MYDKEPVVSDRCLCVNDLGEHEVEVLTKASSTNGLAEDAEFDSGDHDSTRDTREKDDRDIGYDTDGNDDRKHFLRYEGSRIYHEEVDGSAMNADDCSEDNSEDDDSGDLFHTDDNKQQYRSQRKAHGTGLFTPGGSVGNNTTFESISSASVRGSSTDGRMNDIANMYTCYGSSDSNDKVRRTVCCYFLCIHIIMLW